MKIFSNEEILLGIKERDDAVIQYIYQTCFQDIRKLVIMNQGTEQDVQDIFQDALLVIYQKIVTTGLKLRHQFRTYLYSVCRFLWLGQLRDRQAKGREMEYTDDHDGGIQESVDHLESAKMRIYQKHYKELSADCKKVLDMYFQNTSMEEICTVMGYKSVQIAKDKKYRCKKSLMTKINSNPEYKKLKDEIYLVS